MIEIFKMVLQYKEAGVALLFAILFYMDFRKKIASLDKTITNDLFHIIEKDSENTKDVKGAIENLTVEIKRMNKS